MFLATSSRRAGLNEVQFPKELRASEMHVTGPFTDQPQ